MGRIEVCGRANCFWTIVFGGDAPYPAELVSVF